MKQKLFQFWNNCSKRQKKILILLIWLLNCLLYCSIPNTPKWSIPKVASLSFGCFLGFAFGRCDSNV